MSIEDIGSSSPSGLKLNNHAKSFLRETAKWTKFLSIVGFVGIGFLVLLAFFGEIVASSLETSDSLSFSMEGGMYLTIFYLIFAAIYFFPVYYLYKFSNNMKKALEINDEDSLTAAFEMLKSHYKFIGILTIIGLSFYVLLFFIGFAAALSV